MVGGKRHGDLANQIADKIKAQRRVDVGLDPRLEAPMPLPTHKPPEEKRRHELDGGLVVVGRATFKEFMAGLTRGWTDSLEKVDREELLARELEGDGQFDEPDEPPSTEDAHDVPGDISIGGSRLPSAQNSVVFSPLQVRPPAPPPRPRQESSSIPASLNAPPAVIPPLPPILFVSITNYIGFTQIPLMIWDFFNERHKVLAGAQAAHRLIMKSSRAFVGPPSSLSSEPLFADHIPTKSPHQENDLDFDKPTETFYKNSLSSIPSDIEKARKKYYEALPAKLETARAIARGTREMTKEEKEYPPPTEVELRAERMKKELRWAGDLEGWEVVKPDQQIVWDDRFRDALRVFVDPSPGEEPMADSI